jgi:parallel beta-helix repeat protein
MNWRRAVAVTALLAGSAGLAAEAHAARSTTATTPTDTVFVAAPTGERDVDRASIIAALEQVRPGGTVQFAPGTYLVGEIIDVAVPGVTLMGHLNGTTLRGCDPAAWQEMTAAAAEAEVGEARWNVRARCGMLRLTGGHITVRNLTFEDTSHGLVLGWMDPSRTSEGGHLIEWNMFRNSGNGMRVGRLSSGPTVIRRNRFINTYHALGGHGGHLHILDNDISVPEPDRVPDSGFSGYAIALCGEHNVIAGNRIAGHVVGISVAWGWEVADACRHNVIRDNTIIVQRTRALSPPPGVRLLDESDSTLIGTPLILGHYTELGAFEDNLIEGNHIIGAEGIGIEVRNAVRNRIVNNTVTGVVRRQPFPGNWNSELDQVWRDANGSGIWLSPGSDENEIVGNTFKDVAAHAIVVEGERNIVETRGETDRVRDLGAGNRISTPVEAGRLIFHQLGHPVGEESYAITRAGDATVLRADFRQSGWGGRRTRSVALHLGPDLTPTRFELRSSRGDPVAVEAGDDGATVIDASGPRHMPLTGPFFTAGGFAPHAVQWMLVRYWREHGRPDSVPVLPEGFATVRQVGQDTLPPAGGGALVLDRYHVDGLWWGGQTLWLDAENRLIAAVTHSFPYQAVREGYEEHMAFFSERALRGAVARGVELSDGIPPLHTGTFALVGGTVIDGTGAPPLEDAAVLVRDGRIAAVGPRTEADIPPDIVRIDVAGKTVLPGLWEMHAHLGSYGSVDFGPIHLAAGITTVRSVGAETAWELAFRDAFRTERMTGPRLLLAAIIDGRVPGAVTRTQADTPEEARELVRRFHELGFEQIKIYSRLRPELVAVIAEEAHGLGMTVTGHVPRGMTVVDAVLAGMDQINHVYHVLQDMMPDSIQALPDAASQLANLDLDTPQARRVIETLLRHGTVVDPTIALTELSVRPADVPMHAIEPGASRMPHAMAVTQQASWFPSLPPDLPLAFVEEAMAIARKEIELVGILHRAGVPIVAGSDVLVPGHSLHREVELYVEAGMTPLEAIRSATIVPARAMGLDHDVGSVEVGKRADLIVVDGDPLRSIREIRNVRAVITNGRMFDTAALWHSVDYDRTSMADVAGAAAPDTGFVTGADGVRLFYRIEGSGPDTVVVLHGGPALGLAYLAPDLEPLGREHTLLFYDQRGVGRSWSERDVDLSVDRHIEDLEALRSHFGIGRLRLAGHSWGAMLAARYAAAYPEHVERMLFIDPMVPAKTYEAEAGSGARRAMQERLDSVSLAVLDSLVRAAAETPDPRGHCRTLFELLVPLYFADAAAAHRSRGDFCTGSDDAIRARSRVNAAIMGSVGDDVRPFLSRVRSPVLIVHGGSGAIPAEAMHAWADALPDARLMVISDAGHYLHVDRPDVFFPAALEFLRGSWPAGAETTSGTPPAHQTKFADAGGVRLHYIDFGGDGLPVILVPAVTRDATHYEPLGPLLTAGNRVLAITRRGDGQSEDPGGPYDAQTQARDFLHFMDALEIPQAVFISNVGDEITYLAEEHPLRVAGLVFLGGPARGATGEVLRTEPTGMAEALHRLWQSTAGLPPDYSGYVPRYLQSGAPTIGAPALVFVTADGMRGVERENPALMMVGSPLTAEMVRGLRPEDGRAYFERLASDPQYRDRTIDAIPDSVARSYFQRLAADAELQARVQRFQDEILVPAEIAHWGAFRRAFAGGLDLVQLDVPAVSGYEYNSAPELIAPHIRRFLENIRPAGGADTVHVAPPTGERETDRASIHAALAQVQPGGVVQFAPGTYLMGGEIFRVTVPRVTLLGHSEGTTLRGCDPGEFPWEDITEFGNSCNAIELAAGQQTVRNLTFEHAFWALHVGCCWDAPEKRGIDGGHLIEDNTFRSSSNAVRVHGFWSEPTVIRNNRFLNNWHSVAIYGNTVHLLDNDISVPEPHDVQLLGFPMDGVHLAGPFDLHESVEGAERACENNVIAGNRIDGVTEGIMVTANERGLVCRNNVIRNNTIAVRRARPPTMPGFIRVRDQADSTVIGVPLALRGVAGASTLEDNLIEGNIIVGAEGLGIEVRNASRNRIVNNTVTRVVRREPFPGNSMVAMPLIGGNPVAWREANGAGIWISPGSDENEIVGNTFADIASHAIVVEGDRNIVETRSAADAVRDVGTGNRGTRPYEPKFVDVRGVRLQYMDFGGDGLTVIFVQDFHDYFTLEEEPEYASRLAGFADGFRVLAPVRRGWGGSDDTGWGYDVATQSEDLLGIMDALGIERAVLVGRMPANQDMTWIAEHHPERLAGLVYLESPLVFPDFRDPAVRTFAESYWRGTCDLGAGEAAIARTGPRASWRPHFLHDEAARIDVAALRFSMPRFDMVGVDLRRLERVARIATDDHCGDEVAREYFIALAADDGRVAALRRALTEGDLTGGVHHAMERAFGERLHTVLLPEQPDWNAIREFQDRRIRSFLEDVARAQASKANRIAPDRER